MFAYPHIPPKFNITFVFNIMLVSTLLQYFYCSNPGWNITDKNFFFLIEKNSTVQFLQIFLQEISFWYAKICTVWNPKEIHKNVFSQILKIWQ